MTIDINSDMGELDTVDEAAIMPWISSANIACGGHAGDERTMERTLRLAAEHGVAPGAHPSYPDQPGFGRDELAISEGDLEKSVYEQISRLDRVAHSLGMYIDHVKPHGALYNVAAIRPEVAAAIGRAIARWSKDVVLYGLAGSRMLDVWRGQGFAVAAEAFADRAYEPDGSLRSRKLPGALISGPEHAARQAVELAHRGSVQTICVHSDTPNAAAIAQAVREALSRAGVTVSAGSRRG